MEEALRKYLLEGLQKRIVGENFVVTVDQATEYLLRKMEKDGYRITRDFVESIPSKHAMTSDMVVPTHEKFLVEVPVGKYRLHESLI